MFWDYVCFVWLNPLVLGLCVFCLARSTGVRIVCVLFNEINRFLDFLCFVW
jgi:hypothetical protein